MIIALVPYKDATIYEDYPNKNTGLDEILELQKVAYSTGSYAESRALIYFNQSEILETLDYVSNHTASNATWSASLKLNTVQTSQVPLEYSIVVGAISDSWTNGTGKFADAELSGGATWTYRAGEAGTVWATGSFPIGTTGSYYSNPGGGTWYTASQATQSFTFKEDNDVNVNVSSIVEDWEASNYLNNGFIVRLGNILSPEVLPGTNLQFYSSDTHTVYSPQLFIQWDNVTQFNSGSLPAISINDQPIIYLDGFKGEYTTDSIVRVFVKSRPMYPKRTFSQNPSYGTVYALPTQSYYRILDGHTNEVIVDYSEYTKLACNTAGNYFDFSTSVLYPERFYKFQFKSIISSSTVYFIDEYLFKIVN
jgi:hypothetical protein